MERYLKDTIIDDLNDKMVLVGGPRQVGKTTLALSLLDHADETHPAYMNWDNVKVKKSLLAGELPSDQKLLVFDEIHKYKDWRNLIKGFYDLNKSTTKFLVTGSARLDHYRRGGDSLQGRYHYHRLHPLSLYEISCTPTSDDLSQLLEYGGFPEPFLKANKKHWHRWQRERQSRVIHEDLLNLEKIKEVSQLDLLAHVLPSRVGSPLSINNLRQDLSVAFETIERWISILENLYVCFRISPFGLPALRTAKKEKKLYFWDWSLCENESTRFENIVASTLLKYCHQIEDTQGIDTKLFFLRDSMRREIDFIVAQKNKPLFAVECKTGERTLSKNIPFFAARSNIPIFYQVHLGEKDYEVSQHRARVLPFISLSRLLKI